MKIEMFDKIGIFSSATCAIHCFLMPFIITFIQFAGLSFFADESFEIGMLFLSVILALFSLCLGYKIHKSKKILFMFSFGIGMLILGRHFHENNLDIKSGITMLVGGLILSASHFINNKLCKTCKSCTMEIKNVL